MPCNYMDVFVDSDVVISSLLSGRGASHLLLHSNEIIPVISSVSRRELSQVVERLRIEVKDFESLLSSRFRIVPLSQPPTELRRTYEQYVVDIYDAHIVAGAHQAKVRFLLSYNLRHFRAEKIKDDFNILLMTPGMFLQYHRSLS